MNDTELDEMLDLWKAPSPSPVMRKKLQGAIEVKPPRPPRRFFTRWRLATAAATLVFAVLLVSTDASSTNPPAYTVDSEITHYEGALRWTGWPKRILMTSYSDAGNEVILSWSFPDHALDTAYIKMLIFAEQTHEHVRRRLNRIARAYYTWKHDLKSPREGDPDAFVFLTEPDAGFYLGGQKTLLSSGCNNPTGGALFGSVSTILVGREVVLNYATTVVQFEQDKDSFNSHKKTTIWLAPELDCAVLRATVEIPGTGGWKVVTERKALKVTSNR